VIASFSIEGEEFLVVAPVDPVVFIGQVWGSTTLVVLI